ncbi:hypothetical protein C8Q79DRAFT_453508 [Trametes meyenii]|nr:hypothetical protein C8Q79DRAFT_453508 [Trametes meyenii]
MQLIDLSQEDADALVGLSPADLQATTLLRINTYRQRIAQIERFTYALQYVHYSASPLHTALAPELLMEIFRHLGPQREADIRVTHVCRYWRALLHKTPQFWAVLLSACHWRRDTDQDHPCHISTLIKRSSPCPIDLWLPDYPNPSILVALKDHLSCLVSLSLDITCLHAYNNERSNALRQFLELPIPSLRILAIRRDHPLTYPHAGRLQLHNLNANQYPALHTISLWCAALFIPALASPVLRHVEICELCNLYGIYLDDGACTTMASLLDRLRPCSSLKTVKLSWCGVRALQVLRDSPSAHTPPVGLPNLQICHIEDECHVVRSILEHIIIPARGQIILNACADSPDYLFDVLPRSRPLDLFGRIDSLAVRFTPSLATLAGFVRHTELLHIALEAKVRREVWESLTGRSQSDITGSTSDSASSSDSISAVAPKRRLTSAQGLDAIMLTLAERLPAFTQHYKLRNRLLIRWILAGRKDWPSTDVITANYFPSLAATEYRLASEACYQVESWGILGQREANKQRLSHFAVHFDKQDLSEGTIDDQCIQHMRELIPKRYELRIEHDPPKILVEYAGKTTMESTNADIPSAAGPSEPSGSQF